MPSLVSRAVATMALMPALALATSPPATPTTAPKSPETAQALPTARLTIRPFKQYTVEEFLKTTRLLGASFSPDEKEILYSSDETGSYNIFSVPVSGSKPAQHSHSKGSIFAVSYFPKGERILFSTQDEGDGHAQLWVGSPNGKNTKLTQGKESQFQFLGWKKDGSSTFYVLTNERDAHFFDLYKYEFDEETYKRTLLYQNDDNYQVADISGDEKWIALNKLNTSSDSDIYLYNMVEKKHKHITKHTATARYIASQFGPGSTALYYLTDAGSNFRRVARYVLATGKSSNVERANWDVTDTFFSSKGTYRVTTINEDGRTVIRIHDVKTDKPVALPNLPDGEITSVTIARSERLMAFYHNGDRSPRNLCIYEFTTSKTACLTKTLNPIINPEDLVDGQVVYFKSFDNLKIPNILYKPHQATAKNKAPAIIWVHGGPGGQTSKTYSALTQYLVNHGYVVLGINHRGSAGYGKAFLDADNLRHGREPLKDCIAAKEYLASLPYVDESRIGIAGNSYGGYMVLAALAFHPDVFNVGVDFYGVSNWLRTLKTPPPEWAFIRQAHAQEIGDPEKDEKMLKDISPLFHADKIKKPLLVIQGAKDQAVRQIESDDIVKALEKNKVPVEYKVFPDEGHGLAQRKNQAEAYSLMLTFLERYLKKSGTEP